MNVRTRSTGSPLGPRSGIWNSLGILSTRQLRSNRRTGYFIIAVVAVALPGVDPITTVIETVPLWVLYELSIWLSVLMERRQPAPREALL